MNFYYSLEKPWELNHITGYNRKWFLFHLFSEKDPILLSVERCNLSVCRLLSFWKYSDNIQSAIIRTQWIFLAFRCLLMDQNSRNFIVHFIFSQCYSLCRFFFFKHLVRRSNVLKHLSLLCIIYISNSTRLTTFSSPEQWFNIHWRAFYWIWEVKDEKNLFPLFFQSLELKRTKKRSMKADLLWTSHKPSDDRWIPH